MKQVEQVEEGQKEEHLKKNLMSFKQTTKISETYIE
jgi:hypothetical protein